jgi:hypothetical protein
MSLCEVPGTEHEKDKRYDTPATIVGPEVIPWSRGCSFLPGLAEFKASQTTLLDVTQNDLHSSDMSPYFYSNVLSQE